MNYATIQIDIKKDKFIQYLYKRYIRLTEAIWCIFKFLIYEKFLSIKQLIIYFFRNQIFYFEENLKIEELQKKISDI